MNRLHGLILVVVLSCAATVVNASTVSYGSSDGSTDGTITTDSYELDVTVKTAFGEVHLTSDTSGKFLDSEGVSSHAYNVTDTIVVDAAYKQSGNYLIRFASNFNEVGFATSAVSIFQPIVFNRDFSACSAVSHVDWWNHESISLAIGESHDTPFLSINNAAYEMIWARKANGEKTYGWWNIQRTGLKTYVYSARFNISEIGDCIEFDPTYDSMPGSFYDDTYVSQGNATTNYNSGTVFYLGLVAGPNEYEAGFHIYAASLATAAGLSTPVNLDSAELQFKESAVLSSGAANVHWGIPTTDVNFSLVTWNLKPTLVNIDNPISIANTGSATNTIDGAEFTQLVEDWINGATPNYGIWIDSNSSSGDRTEFVSQEGTQDPYFSITTTPEYDFIAQSAVLNSDEFIVSGTQALADGTENLNSITIRAFSDQTIEIVQAGTRTIKNASNGLWVVIAEAPTAMQAVNSIITVNSGSENSSLPVFLGGGGGSSVDENAIASAVWNSPVGDIDTDGTMGGAIISATPPTLSAIDESKKISINTNKRMSGIADATTPIINRVNADTFISQGSQAVVITGHASNDWYGLDLGIKVFYGSTATSAYNSPSHSYNAPGLANNSIQFGTSSDIDEQLLNVQIVMDATNTAGVYSIRAFQYNSVLDATWEFDAGTITHVATTALELSDTQVAEIVNRTTMPLTVVDTVSWISIADIEPSDVTEKSSASNFSASSGVVVVSVDIRNDLNGNTQYDWWLHPYYYDTVQPAERIKIVTAGIDGLPINSLEDIVTAIPALAGKIEQASPSWFQ